MSASGSRSRHRVTKGARDVDVLLQFLVEAVVLSVAGGAIGIAVGFGAS